jgi:hypothetical protein
MGMGSLLSDRNALRNAGQDKADSSLALAGFTGSEAARNDATFRSALRGAEAPLFHGCFRPPFDKAGRYGAFVAWREKAGSSTCRRWRSDCGRNDRVIFAWAFYAALKRCASQNQCFAVCVKAYPDTKLACDTSRWNPRVES